MTMSGMGRGADFGKARFKSEILRHSN
jgi:hypothetical protein